MQVLKTKPKPRIWEAAVGYEQAQRDQAQKRFQALQLEMRLTRQRARQTKKETDPG